MQKKVILSLVMLVSAGCLVATLRSKSIEQAKQLQKRVASEIVALESSENEQGAECPESDNAECSEADGTKCSESDCTEYVKSDCTECSESDDTEVVEKQEE